MITTTGLAGAEAARDVERAVNRRCRRSRPRRCLLATREPACGEEGVLVRHLENLVDDREVEGPHHEIVADPFDPVDPGLADLPLIERIVVHAADRVGARHEQRPAGLGRLLLQILRRPRDRAAGADPADEGVEPAVGLLPDLRAGGQVMGFGVVHVEVLIRYRSRRGSRTRCAWRPPRSSRDGRAADRCG